MLPLICKWNRQAVRLTPWLVGLAPLLLTLHGAYAQTQPAPPSAALCSSGRAAIEASYRKLRDPSLLCELARCARAENQPVAALNLYRRCVAERGTSLPAELTKEAEAAQKPLPADVGELFLRGPNQANVNVDERLVGVLPLPERLLLSPGAHQLTIEHGALRVSQSVRIRPGQGLRISLVGNEVQVNEPFSVLVLPPRLPGAEPETEPLLQSIEDAVLRAKGEPLRRGFRSQVLSAAPRSACERSCQVMLGSKAESLYVLETQVQPMPSGDLQLAASVLDVRVQRESARQQATCPRGDRAQLVTALAQLVEQVIREGQRPVGVLDLSAHPGARVELDGEPAGQTPLRALSLFVGPHRLRLQRPYFVPIEQRFSIDEGRTHALSFSLRPAPRTRGERFAQIGKWVLASAGLVALGVGIGLVVKDRLVSTDYELAPQGDLRIEHNLKPPGYALLGVGGATLLVGITLAGFDGYGQRQRHIPER